MDLAAKYQLASDVVIADVSSLPGAIADDFPARGLDCVVSRSFARTTSVTVTPAIAMMLEQFRVPTTLVDAVLRFCTTANADPDSVLDAVAPHLLSFAQKGFLVPEGSRGRLVFEPDTRIGRYVVVRVIETFTESAVAFARDEHGQPCVLKIARSPSLLPNESNVLELVKPPLGPRKYQCSVESVDDEQVDVLALEWIDGKTVDEVARRLRGDRPRLLQMCHKIIQAYVDLHEKGVFHGDIHPRNILVTEDDEIRLIDFGYAAVSSETAVSRAAVLPFMSPELARSNLERLGEPILTQGSEQYSLAAVLYYLICGAPYLDLPMDRGQALESIYMSPPLSFSSRGVISSDVEAVLRRALEKESESRFASMREFRAAWCTAIAPKQSSTPELERLALLRPDDVFLLGPRCSLAHGAAGLALSLLRLSEWRDDPHLLAIASCWADWGVAHLGDPHSIVDSRVQTAELAIPRSSLLFGHLGVHVARVLVADAENNETTWIHSADAILTLSDEVEARDLTIGRAGALFALSQCYRTKPNESDLTRRIGETCERLAKAVGQELQHESSNHGIAHGSSGSLFALFDWCGVKQDNIEVDEAVGRLIDAGGGSRRDPWIAASWCNGAAGLIQTLVAARPLCVDTRIDATIERLADEVYINARGGPPTVCCGVVGAASALYLASNVLNDIRWTMRAEDLLHTSVRRGKGRQQEGFPFSLFNGSIGLALALEEHRLMGRVTMPLFQTTSA